MILVLRTLSSGNRHSTYEDECNDIGSMYSLALLTDVFQLMRVKMKILMMILDLCTL